MSIFTIFMQLNHKIKIIIAVFIIIFMSSTLYSIYLMQFDATIHIYSIPDRLTMSYDNIKNQNISSKKDIKVKHGSYKFTFSSDGFEDYTTTLTIGKNEAKNVKFELKPITDKAKKEYSSSKYTDVKEGIFNQNSIKSTQQLESNSPIIKDLPIYSDNFYIFPCDKYRSTSDKSIGICITVTDYFNWSQINDAFNRLKKKGISLTDYDIKVNNRIWPTEEEKANGSVIKCKGMNPDWCYIYNDI